MLRKAEFLMKLLLNKSSFYKRQLLNMSRISARITSLFRHLRLLLAALNPIKPRGAFLESFETYGSFSGVTIPFVSQDPREFESSNLTVIFLLFTLKTC